MAEKQALEISIFAVEHEIEDLLRQLDLKREQRTRLQGELVKVDGRIHDVRKKYERQLRRASDRRAEHVLIRREVDEDEGKARALHEKRAIELSALLATQRAARGSADAAALDVCVAGLLCAHVASDDSPPLLSLLSPSTAVVNAAAGTFPSGSSGGGNTAGERLDALEARIGQMELQRAQLVAHSQSLLRESESAADRLPKLEAEKKAHASSKRFKEAAAAATAIKDAAARKEVIDAELLAAGAQLEQLAVEAAGCAADKTALLLELREGNEVPFQIHLIKFCKLSRQLSNRCMLPLTQ